MSKHTHGPWHLAVNDTGHFTSVRNSDDTRKICVARVNNQTESNANMRLIATAPEMLEALKKSKRVIRSLKLSMQAHPDNEPGSEFDDFTQTAERMELEIEELIKKATL